MALLEVGSDLVSGFDPELEPLEEVTSVEGTSVEVPGETGFMGSVESLEIGATSAGFAWLVKFWRSAVLRKSACESKPRVIGML